MRSRTWYLLIAQSQQAKRRRNASAVRQSCQSSPAPPHLECLACGLTEGVEMESSRTCYHYEGEIGGPDDPNRPFPLCRPCAEEHHMNWNHTWAEYHAGLL